MPSADDSSSRQKLALIIGNNDYKRKENRLEHSVSNARQLSDLLQTINFKVTSCSNIDKEILKKTSTFAETIKDGDIVLFYFSGHCRQVGDENYLIPTDDERIANDVDVEEIGTSATRVLSKLIEKNKSYINIFILDCCKQYFLKNESPSNPPIQNKGLTSMNPSDETFIQFACATNQIVNNNQKKKHDNLFAQHLLKNIVLEDVSITDVFQKIVNSVIRKSHGKQQPLSINGLHKHGQVCLYVMPDGTYNRKGFCLIEHDMEIPENEKINDCNCRIVNLKQELEELALQQPHEGSAYDSVTSNRIHEIRALIHTLTLRRQAAIYRRFSTFPVK